MVLVRRSERISDKNGILDPTFSEFGQELELEGVINEPSSPTNFGLFSYRDYLRQQGIAYVVHSDSNHEMKVMGNFYHPWMFQCRRILSARLSLGIESDEIAVGIIKGMLLGYREDIPEDVNESFRRTGTLHVFAISGSHISLIALVILFLLKQLRVPQRWVALMVVPILVMYVFMTGLRSSSIRSVLMASVIILGWSLERPSALLNNLAVSAFLILIWNPLQLFDPGFQLSFVVVSALILLAPVLDSKFRTWIESDPWIPRMCVSKWRLMIAPPLRWVSSLVSVSLAAWVGTLGLSIYYFHLLSMTSVLANLLIVPLASASVALGAVSLLFGIASDQLAVTFNCAHAFLIHWMIGITEYLSSKGGYVYVSQGNVWLISVSYLAFGLIVFLWLKNRKRWAMGLLSVIILTAGISFYLTWTSYRVRLDVLDMESGQAILITGPRFERILVDAGNSSQGKRAVKPFLRSRGVNSIDLAIISHADAAHYGGFQALIKDIPIRRFAVAETQFRSKTYEKFLTEIRDQNIPIQAWNVNTSEELLSGKLNVLWPLPHSESPRADDFGLVFDLQTKFGSCLFLSDAGMAVEEMIAPRLTPEYSIVIQGWNGDSELFSADFLELTKPSMLVLTIPNYSRENMAEEPLESGLKQKVASILRTGKNGGMTLILDRPQIQFDTYLKK